MTVSARNITLLLLGILVLLPVDLRAENRVGAYTLTPHFGYQWFDSQLNVENDFSYGFAAGYNMTETWGIEADLRYTDTQTKDKILNPVTANLEQVDREVWTMGLNFLYHLAPESTMNPYLLFGGGGNVYESTGSGGDNEDYMLNWGVGFKYALSETLNLRGDFRQVLNASADKEFTTDGDGDKWLSNFMATVGLTFQLGGSSTQPVKAVRTSENLHERPLKDRSAETLHNRPPEIRTTFLVPGIKKPVDNDRDRVLDSVDKCLGTALGVRVDQDGCPADTDGDGVFDFQDACIDTPSGATVDTSGCPKMTRKPTEGAGQLASMSLNIMFGNDKDRVTPFHYRELTKAVDFIEQYPGHRIGIEGHTDNVGEDRYNTDLSQRRADNIRKVLVAKYGVDPSRVTASGMGPIAPIASNDTEEGRLQNRRVEIVVLP